MLGDRRRDASTGGPAIELTLFLFLVLGWLGLSGCAMPTVSPTPTPTRTPRPTLTPTSTLTPTPSPTPTPAFPITVGCTEAVPDAVCARLEATVVSDPEHFAWAGSASAQATLDTRLGSSEGLTGNWIYAVAAPFFTVEDEVTLADLQSTWQGSPAGPFALHPLLAATDTVKVMSELWGPPAEGVLQLTDADRLLTGAKATEGWALLPFDELTPEWKVMRLDGTMLLEKNLSLEDYPLQIGLHLHSETRPEALDLLGLSPSDLTNRDESQMTLVAMTGVTALSRSTARLMDTRGITYPARDILPWFADADFVHISNEVSFKPDCVTEPSGTLSFCSHDSYIGLLEEIGTNVVELTGNHLADKGYQWIYHSLDMYRERGWGWYGGGEDFADATRPLTITHNGNHIAFLGCNPSGVGAFASEERPGAAPCYEPWQHELMQGRVEQLRAEGYLPIVTLQHREVDQYAPWPGHIRDLRAYAAAGAIIVHGSQAHWVKPMEFHSDAFIHYGPGNLFFDQMWADGVRQGFLTRYTFYEGRLLGIELRTYVIEEYGRPRPMTVGDPDPVADRRAFLQMMFDLRP